ncbi:MAG: glycosyltransferase family 87 protein, partial [Phycisphaerales bacterium]
MADASTPQTDRETPKLADPTERWAPPAWLPALILIGILGFFAYGAATRFLGAPDSLPGQGTEVGDFQHYYHAALAIRMGENPYDAGIRWYGYLPMFAILLVPLGLLTIQQAGAVWVGVNTMLTLAILWLAAKEFLRRFDGPRDLTTVFVVMLVGFLVVFDKVRGELRLGQTDALIVLGYVLGLRWMGRRPILSGLALAMSLNVKYQSLIFIPYLLARRRWTEAASMMIGGVGIALAGSLIFGWNRNLEYLQTALAGILDMVGILPNDAPKPTLFPVEWHRSVSLPSVFARLSIATDMPGWIGWALVLVCGGIALALGWWMYARWGQRLFAGRFAKADDATPTGRALVGLEWAGLVVALMAFSPQNTSRHLYQLILL